MSVPIVSAVLRIDYRYHVSPSVLRHAMFIYLLSLVSLHTSSHVHVHRIFRATTKEEAMLITSNVVPVPAPYCPFGERTCHRALTTTRATLITRLVQALGRHWFGFIPSFSLK